jgi:hypothetical protein
MNWILLYNTAWGFAEEIHYPLIDDYVLTSDPRHFDEAVAVVFHMPTIKKRDPVFAKEKKRFGQLWVFMSMECEAHYEWQYEPELLSLFDLEMTYKLDADIPTPYFYPRYKESLLRKPVAKTALINAFISSNFDRSNRIQSLAELMSVIEVHSYGNILNNKKIDKDEGVKTKAELISTYKFTIAFENAIARDYVTEKFFQPLIMGSVPIYLGAPNIEEFAPGDNCYINVTDFSSIQELGEYIMELDSNEEKYNSYLKWKELPLREDFIVKTLIQKDDQFIRLSNKIKAIKDCNVYE